jgi:glycosyltransferase involved in cell wall biosynthesis
MRILHIDTERGWRGGERQTLWLAAELARRGHHSIVAARPGEPLEERARAAGLDIIACAPAFEVDPRVVYRLRRLVRRTKIEIVHAHTGHAVGLAALATLGTAARLVASRRVDFHLRRNLGTRWKYDRADALVAVSRAVAGILVADGIDPARVVVVPDGTDLHRDTAPAQVATLESLGIVAGRPIAVQVAQLVGHKDPLNFVRAIAAARRSVPELQGLLVGDGPLRPHVESEIAALRLTGAVHLAGYRTDADALLAASDVVVLSSREEGMGSVLLDAFVLGKPIAATRAGGIPDIIEHEVNGLLAPVADATALGAHIAALLTDRPLAVRLALAAKARAPEFSVERMTDRTLEIYERVAARAPLAAANEATRADAATRARSTSSTRAP